MIIIGETNLLVRHLFEQDDNATYLINLAEEKKIELYIPYICIPETLSVARNKISKRKELAKQLREKANDIGRSQKYKLLADHLKTVAEEIDKSCEGVIEDIEKGLDKIGKEIKIVPSDEEMWHALGRLHACGYIMNLSYGLHPPDDFIFASVIYIAQEVKSPTLFVTTDRDFEKPEIIEHAKRWKVEIVFSHGEVINRFYKQFGG